MSNWSAVSSSLSPRFTERSAASTRAYAARNAGSAGGNNIVGSKTPEFTAFLAAESKKWGTVFRAGNIKLDE